MESKTKKYKAALEVVSGGFCDIKKFNFPLESVSNEFNKFDVESMNDFSEEISVKNIENLIESYFNNNYKQKNNANEGLHLSSLQNFVVKQIFEINSLSYYSNYVPDAVYLHKDGYLYIHDFAMSKFSPYCAGWDLREILENPVLSFDLQPEPAKWIDSAVSHFAQHIHTSSMEWQGAQGYDKVDVILAPFVRKQKNREISRILEIFREKAARDAGKNYNDLKDGWKDEDWNIPSVKEITEMDYFKNKIKYDLYQSIQNFVFSINFRNKSGFQSPFVNILLRLRCPTSMKDEFTVPFISGKDDFISGKSIKYGDLDEEIRLVAESFFKVLSEGDSNGKPFSFPIITVQITKNFPWDSEIVDSLFDMVSKSGSAYFMKIEDAELVYSMCCRLKIDRTQLEKQGGVYNFPGKTGSIGVVTINLPRVGFENRLSEHNYSFIDAIKEVMKDIDWLLENSRRYLYTKRISLEKTFSRLLKVSSNYLTVKRMVEYDENHPLGYQRLYNHFSTIGLVGGNEFLKNLTSGLIDLKSQIGQDILEYIVKHILDKIREFQIEDSIRYNLEATPAENAAPRLAWLDCEKYSGLDEKPYFSGKEGALEYSNAVSFDYTERNDIFKIAEIGSKLGGLFTGGHVEHFYLESEVNPETLKNITKKIISETDLPYFTWTPTISICGNCSKKFFGNVKKCISCGSNTKVYTRVVGYYAELNSMNPARNFEADTRPTFFL